MLPNEQPLISAIIPAFNAAEFLPAALDSIWAQKYPKLEIIVVDDGSTDNTRELLQQWPSVRYLSQSNAGPAAARNAGIAAANSDILAFLDADDLWTANHLQVLLPELMNDPNLAFVWGASRVVRLFRQSDGCRNAETLHEAQHQFLIGSGLYRRKAFELVGSFDPALRFAEDIDWFNAARQRGVSSKKLPDEVLIYHKHAGGMTAGKSFQELNVFTAMRRSIARRRGENANTGTA